MLVEFKVGNFRSIGVEQTVSFVASSDKTHRQRVITEGLRGNLGLLRSVLFYGANASGKSNICQALFYLRQAVLTSSGEMSEGDEFSGIVPFQFHSDLAVKPSMLEAAVSIDGDIYRYGVELTARTVEREWLFLTRKAPGSSEVLLFSRFGADKTRWKFGSSFRGSRQHLIRHTRASNGLLLSKAAQESYEQLTPLYNWFRNRLNVVNMTNNVTPHVIEAVGRCHAHDETKATMARLISVADETVVDVQTRLEHHVLPAHVKLALADELPEGLEVPEEFDQAAMSLVRSQSDTGNHVSLDFATESNGTKRFIAAVSLVLRALKLGQVLVLDELECSLHPILMRQLLEVLNDTELGESSAQFVIATHDTNLFDFDLLRRDQIYLVEKDSLTLQTDVYSLNDLEPRPRADAAGERQYLAHRFGGVPRLGNLRQAIIAALETEERWEEDHTTARVRVSLQG